MLIWAKIDWQITVALEAHRVQLCPRPAWNRWKVVPIRIAQDICQFGRNKYSSALEVSCSMRDTTRWLMFDRKLLLCALARKDVGSAREIFNSMSDSARNEPMSRFLMYKISIRCGDTELAAECLQAISSAAKTTHDLTLLYGCVLDAQQIGDKTQTLAGLQFVLEKSDHGTQTATHLPSLLRLTISLMVALLDEKYKHGNLESSGIIDKLCAAFEKGRYNNCQLIYLNLTFYRCRCCSQSTGLVERPRPRLDDRWAWMVLQELLQPRYQVPVELGPALFPANTEELSRFHEPVP